MIISRVVVIALLILFWLCPFAQAQDAVFFTPNRGQWDARIQYQMEIPGGYFYLEKNAQTYYFIERHDHHPGGAPPEFIKTHAFKVNFINSNPQVLFNEERQTPFYYNYFIGNDPSRWKSWVYSYKKITYRDLYPGIDYVIGEEKGQLKSDYIVHAGANAGQIKLMYEGTDGLSIHDGKLIIKTSLAEIAESTPYAYQVVNDIKVQVPCEYVLEKNRVYFKLGNYNKALDLVIDPVLSFSTYIGATADNFGCTATYDKKKNVFGGALVYASGVYPTTLGAFQTLFAGSSLATRDMGISKFDSTGQSLMFSTYLGGAAGTEVPHSLVADQNDNLFIFGTTGSSNYPTTATAYDPTFNGGASVSAASQGLDYPLGTDIVISKLNATGTVLLASTYLGGSGNDGLNFTTALNYNYGDIIRGEIIVDAAGNPIICSTTASANYPVSAGAPQTTLAGPTDAVITKLNANLTGITWSTFFGGTGSEAGYGMQPDLLGNLFFTGGTTSSNLPVTPGAYHPAFGGLVDGFLAKINPTGTVIMSSSYVGTASYDQSYLIQVDSNNDVYIFGQTTGVYPITPGKYSNPNSGQFIHKFNNNITASIWSTRIGTGSGQIDISPTAFLLNKCNKIYICGWGGTVNHFGQADFSTTFGLPVTTDAFQPGTDGSDFYLAIFSQDMTALEYGTFFGGSISAEHVDGGTARFDKDGVVYQAVCAGCGGHDDFPTTPGAWSATNNSSNCNLGVFKFNLDNIVASAFEVPISAACGLPYTVSFTNTSVNTNLFHWDFGDGTTSTDADPIHTYTSPGDYIVVLIGIDTTTCNATDTFNLLVNVPEPISLIAPASQTICEGSSLPITITGTGADSYLWSPATGVSSPTSGTVVLNPTATTTYTVIGTNNDGCSDTVSFTVTVVPHPNASFTFSFEPCVLPSAFTFSNSSTGTTSYFWDFGDGFTSTLANPEHIYADSGNYTITLIVEDSTGCGFKDTAVQSVFVAAPLTITLEGQEQICLGGSSDLLVTGGTSWEWTPTSGLSDPGSSSPSASPNTSTEYTVIATDDHGCKDTATISITVIQPPSAVFTPVFTPCSIPVTVAFNNSSTNAYSFIWMLDGITTTETEITHVFNTPGNYTITLIAVDTSSCGFNDTTTTEIFLPPPAQANAWGSDTICLGFSLPLYASGGVTYSWSPAEDFENPNSQNAVATPNGNTSYMVTVTDTNGCSDMASVEVFTFPVQQLEAGNDLTYDMGQGPLLHPSVPVNGTFYWTPPTGLSCTNCLTPEATPEVTTTYYLHFTDQYGCPYIDSVTVWVTPSVFIPNAFTPNGDGLNDVFIPVVRNLKTFQINIFDRWGELIFTSEEMRPVWDGTHKGIKVKPDVYVWKIRYTSEIDPNNVKEQTGHVTLLR